MEKEMYLFVFEDMNVWKSENFTEDDKNSCECGILNVIRISDLKTYFEGEWHELSNNY